MHLSVFIMHTRANTQRAVVCQDAHDGLPHGPFSSRLADLQALTAGQKVMLGVFLALVASISLWSQCPHD